ncbi:hypothetical protein DXB60_14550 [Bacteroides fragilis]|uniref:Uncharacterized protein n=1 Tax=Bacteroides fragilis TaxID=817 RepID=A0A0I9UJD6_BACFG|nr:hypothetical protein DXB60_14550 [Bacteroides fragilis]
MLTSFPGNAYCFCRKSRLFTSSTPALHLRKTGFPAFLPLVCRSFKESLFVKQLISFLNVFLSVVIPFFMIFPLSRISNPVLLRILLCGGYFT